MPRDSNTEAELALILRRVVEILAPKAAPTDPDEWLPLDATPAPYRAALAAIKAGELRASKVGRQYLVRRPDFDAWLEACRVKPDAKVVDYNGVPPSLGARVLELGGADEPGRD